MAATLHFYQFCTLHFLKLLLFWLIKLSSPHLRVIYPHRHTFWSFFTRRVIRFKYLAYVPSLFIFSFHDLVLKFQIIKRIRKPGKLNRDPLWSFLLQVAQMTKSDLDMFDTVFLTSVLMWINQSKDPLISEYNLLQFVCVSIAFQSFK